MARSSRDEKAAFGDVRLKGRRRKGGGGLLVHGRCLYGGEFWQATDGGPELLGQVAVAGDAVAFAAVERVFAAPVAQDHFGVVDEVAVDGNFGTVDGERCDAKPVGIGVIGGFAVAHACAGTQCR